MRQLMRDIEQPMLERLRAQKVLLLFLRTYDNQEIDLIEEYNGALYAYEIKSGKKMPKAPLAFRTAYPDATFSVINRENYLEYIL